MVIHGASDRLAGFLCRRGFLEWDSREVSAYGLELLLSGLLGYLAVLAAALLCGEALFGLVFLLLVTVTRSYTGGYHADSHCKCVLTGSLMFLIAVAFFRVTARLPLVPLNLCLAAFNLSVVSGLAPVEHGNKPVTKRQKARGRKIGLLLALLESALALLLSIFGYKQSTMVSASLWIVSINILLEKGRGCKDEKRTRKSGV